MKIVALFLVLSGCVAQEKRECIDYTTITYEREKCIPFYGTLVCATEEVTEIRCTRYEDAIEERKKP